MDPYFHAKLILEQTNYVQRNIRQWWVFRPLNDPEEAFAWGASAFFGTIDLDSRRILLSDTLDMRFWNVAYWFFQNAAKKQHALAHYMLGMMHNQDSYYSNSAPSKIKDYKKAYKHFEKCADLGEPLGRLALANLILENPSHQPDLNTAKKGFSYKERAYKLLFDGLKDFDFEAHLGRYPAKRAQYPLFREDRTALHHEHYLHEYCRAVANFLKVFPSTSSLPDFFVKIERSLKPSCVKGYACAMAVMGLIYERKSQENESLDIAFYWFHKAALCEKWEKLNFYMGERWGSIYPDPHNNYRIQSETNFSCISLYKLLNYSEEYLSETDGYRWPMASYFLGRFLEKHTASCDTEFCIKNYSKVLWSNDTKIALHRLEYLADSGIIKAAFVLGEYFRNKKQLPREA